MRGTIVFLFSLLLLTPAFLHAGEPVTQQAFGSEEAPAPAPAACPAPQAREAQSLSSSENWCGAPCSPNGVGDECIGYNACGVLQIDFCRCHTGHWLCGWPCW